MPTKAHSLALKGEKPCWLDVHPTLPWVCYCLKHDFVLILYNFVEEGEIFRFALPTKLDEKREEGELLRAMAKEAAPERPSAKLGQVRSLHFYDNDVICANVNAPPARFTADLGAPNVLGRWLVITCELKLVVLSLDVPSQVLELSSGQLEGKAITSMSPLYSVPVFAVGCADGFIRLWNYETNVVNATKLVVPGGKNVSKVLVLHLSDLPEKVSIVGAAESGSIVCFEGTNAASSRPSFGSTWILSKLHETAVVDMCYDPATGELATLSAAGVAIVVHFASGRAIKKVKLGRKNHVPRQMLLSRTEKGGLTSQYLLPCLFTKVMTVARSLAEASQQDLTEFTSSKKGVEIKVYMVAVHPTIPCLVFACTNAGAYSFMVAPDWDMPLCAVAYEADSEAPFVDNGIVSARDRVKALVRTLYYVRDTKLHYRVIQPLTDDAWGPARFSEEKESAFNILSATSGPAAISASPCGRFLAVVLRDSATVEIRSVKTGQVMNSNAIGGDCLVWHSHLDVFATSRPDGNAGARRVALYEVHAQQGSVTQLTPSMDTLMPVKAIFGGRWLGVSYLGDEDHFQFYKWDGQSSIGGLLPQPVDVLWDRSGSLCALLYAKSIAIMRCHQKVFGLLCTVEVAARSALWWNGCLLVDTWRQIRLILPAQVPSSLLLCSSEVLPVVSELGSAAPGEDFVPALSSPTASRTGSRFGMSFSSKGSAISAADSKVLRSGLDVASVFKRSKPPPEEVDVLALLPSPTPTGYSVRSAKNLVPLRPPGLLTFVEVVDVTLYVMDSDRRLHGIFIGTPEVLWRVLAQTGKPDVALEWQTHPDVRPAELAAFLAQRGYVREALSVTLSPADRLRLAVQYREYACAREAILALQDAVPAALLFDLLNGVALQCSAHDAALAERCFAAAAELSL